MSSVSRRRRVLLEVGTESPLHRARRRRFDLRSRAGSELGSNLAERPALARDRQGWRGVAAWPGGRPRDSARVAAHRPRTSPPAGACALEHHEAWRPSSPCRARPRHRGLGARSWRSGCHRRRCLGYRPRCNLVLAMLMSLPVGMGWMPEAGKFDPSDWPGFLWEWEEHSFLSTARQKSVVVPEWTIPAFATIYKGATFAACFCRTKPTH
jgi:hypothetical protein